MKTTISHGQLESYQAYPQRTSRNDCYQCPNCFLFKMEEGDANDMCRECWKNYKMYQCSDCVKCHRLVETDNTSDDGYCEECYLEVNPC